MFELDDLTTPLLTAKRRSSPSWLCVSCRRVTIVHAPCAFCAGRELIPYLDQRPLLLSKEVKNIVLDLIDQAAARVPQVDIDEQIHLVEGYMTFLSRLLDSAQLAEKRKAEGNEGFRATSLSTEELIALFRDMKLPPTE